MKIGIVTQPLKVNYGGLLQNWALQQVLRDLGHDPVTIDAYMEYPKWRYYMSCAKTAIMRTFGSRKPYPPLSRYGRESYANTAEFIHRHISMTRPIKPYTPDIVERYGLDALVVGSDQVWRPMYNKSIYDMYLEFAKDLPCRKVVYAASFGVDHWEYDDEQTTRCRELAVKFDAVSVREESGVTLCREQLGIDASHVLDPTLLIDRQRYETLCSNVPVDEEPALVAYCLDPTVDKRRLFEEQALKRGLRLKLLTAEAKSSLTPQQWLAAFRDANEVITDSFHGTVFSIIFGKPCNIFVNDERGASRFQSLFRQLALDTRQDGRLIHLDNTKDTLASQRKSSLDYLRDNLY